MAKERKKGSESVSLTEKAKEFGWKVLKIAAAIGLVYVGVKVALHELNAVLA